MTFSHWIDRPAGRAAISTPAGLITVTIHPLALSTVEKLEGEKAGNPHYAQKNLADRQSLTPNRIFCIGKRNSLLPSGGLHRLLLSPAGREEKRPVAA